MAEKDARAGERTVIEVLEATAAEFGDRPAMRIKQGGEWRVTRWNGYRDGVMAVARSLIHLGVEPGGGVAIMGYNRPEWYLADIGAIAAGAVPAGIYTTNTSEQCQYIAHHMEAKVAVLENRDYLDKFLAIRDRLPHLGSIVLMEGEGSEEGVLSWDEFVGLGAGVPDAELRSRIETQKLDDCCTLIYTSGTTGTPKAVMLSHRNLTWTARAVTSAYDIDSQVDLMSYLPLSHIAEQIVTLHCPMAIGACSWFAESLEKLGDNLREVRPQFFLGVPRVWEKIQAAIQAAGAQNPGLKKKIAAWARGVGLRAGYAEQRGASRPLLYPLAEKLVFSKVRERLGLDRASVCATAAAPISLDTLEFFLSLGIPILEVYGMSEDSGPTTFSYPDNYRTGKTGTAIPGTELKIADDGEVLIRGPHVFLGYYKNEEATRETLDDDGWLRSGDLGSLDDDGFLSITGRKKELIITSGGKNIAPSGIEGHLKEIEGVAQALVIGDRRKYLVALLTLDPERVAGVAEAIGSPARDPEAAAECSVFRKHIEDGVEEVNSRLARYETLKKFALLSEDFSIDGGELTPTMKIKRRMVHEKYAEAIEGLYS